MASAKTIGLVCGVVRRERFSPLGDSYSFAMRYIDCVAAAGGVPVGILPCEGRAKPEALLSCDALCILGGDRILPYHIQAVETAFLSGKKLLAICLGMQAMHSYFVAREDALRLGRGDVPAHYECMKREKYMFTEPVERHFVMPEKLGLEHEAAHAVRVEKDSLLYRSTGQEILHGVTLHNYRITKPAAGLGVSARHADGTIEAVEYGTRMLGVQFHPEMSGTQCLFDWLCED